MLGEYTNKKMAAASSCQLQNNTMIQTRCDPSSFRVYLSMGLTHSEVFCDKWWLVPKTHERICLIRSDVQVLFCDRALCASMVYVNPTLSITHTHTFSSNCFFGAIVGEGGDEIDWHFHLWIGAPAKCHLKSSFFRILESGVLGF